MKHRGRTVDFTWAQADLNSIHWAAFYGDCEHEVLEVTDGYRITLTYNLYYSSISLFASLVADPRHFSLYHIAGDALREADFMPSGKALDTFSLSPDTDLANRRYIGLLLPLLVRTFPREEPEVVARGFQGRRSRRLRMFQRFWTQGRSSFYRE